MSQYIQRITDSLTGLISGLAENPSLFLRNPKVDFSRNRKISFKTLIGITMNSGGCTMSKELMDYFGFAADAPSVSAYTQQRAKVLPEAFEYLFHEFTQENIPSPKDYDGYRIVACDGSNLTIANNPSDPDTAWACNQFGCTCNHLHLNVFYDVLNRIYVDAVVQTASEYNESRAGIIMLERSNLKNVLLVADRGYENYNLMAHAINKGWKFLVRIKDINSNGMAAALSLPEKAVFDMDVEPIFTRRQTKHARAAGYKFMPNNQAFDYLPPGSKGIYRLPFRIARFPIGDDSYEVVATNLDRFSFPVEKLKEIYGLRWGIETIQRTEICDRADQFSCQEGRLHKTGNIRKTASV